MAWEEAKFKSRGREGEGEPLAFKETEVVFNLTMETAYKIHNPNWPRLLQSFLSSVQQHCKQPVINSMDIATPC